MHAWSMSTTSVLPPRRGAGDGSTSNPNIGGRNGRRTEVQSSREEVDDEALSVPKPDTFSLNKFKSKRAAAIANVETLLTALPHHPISQAKDFVRLHPDEEKYWSPELCFVN